MIELSHMLRLRDFASQRVLKVYVTNADILSHIVEHLDRDLTPLGFSV